MKNYDKSSDREPCRAATSGSCKVPMPRPSLEEIGRIMEEEDREYEMQDRDDDFGLCVGWQHMQDSRGWR